MTPMKISDENLYYGSLYMRFDEVRLQRQQVRCARPLLHIRKMCVCVVAVLFASISAFGLTATVDGIKWTYTVSNGNASVGGGTSSTPAVSTSTSGAIAIPSKLGGYSVTSIGKYAFYNCTSLTSVTIPDSVTIIESAAFYGCSGLTSVTIPASVKSIDRIAFYNCSGLTSMTIPNSVTSIGDSVFHGCSGLTQITLPFVGKCRGNAGSAESLFGYIFGTSEYTGGTVTYQSYATYGSASGSYYIPSKLRVVTVTDETIFGYGAFSGCNQLTSVTIPNGVTSIGEWAFKGCSKLTSVTIPDSVMSIGDCAFGAYVYATRCSSLTSVTIGNGVKSIGKKAFYQCTGLTSVTIPDSVTSIGDSAFCQCSSLKNITIGNGVKSIGKNAFSQCSGLTNVTIGNGVTSIGQNAFSGCSDLLFDVQTIPGVKLVDGWAVGYLETLSDNLNLAGVCGISDSAFSNFNGLTSVTIPDSVTSIGTSAFYGCCGITSVKIGQYFCSHWSLRTIFESSYQSITNVDICSGVTTIGSSTFKDCYGLKSMTIPESVTSIGQSAFSGCSSITSVTIPDGVTSIEQLTFAGCSGLTSVTIGNGVASIGDSAFFGCIGLTNVAISGNVTNIGSSAFSGCSGLTSVTIADGVKSIGQSAFSGCIGLTRVTIPGSVTSIGREAFYGCNSEMSIVVFVTALKGVTENVFGDCSATLLVSDNSQQIPSVIASNVRKVVFLDGVTEIGDDYFVGCTSLETIDIAESVVRIGVNFFDMCSSLDTVVTNGCKMYQGWCLGFADASESSISSLTIPEGTRGIASGAFVGHYEIDEVVFPSTLKFIGAMAFKGCTGIADVLLPGNVVAVDRDAFHSCTYVQTLSLPNTLLDIGNGAFANCTMLISLTCPEGVETIGDAAFSNCWRMMSAAIPSSVKNVGDSAFADCRRLTGVTVPAGLKTIAELFPAAYDKIVSAEVVVGSSGGGDGTPRMVPGMFMGCVALTDLALPEGLKDVSENAFVGCTSIPSFNLPNTVTNIGARAFKNLSQLTSFSFPSALESIGDEAFLGCTRISALSLPDGLENIGANAFNGCSTLTSIVMPEGLKKIGDYAFRNDNLLTQVNIPASVTSIGTAPFEGCGNIWSVSLPCNVKKMSEIFPSAYQRITSVTVVGVSSENTTPRMVPQMFMGCAALEDLTLPEWLSEVSEDAFAGCVSIPDVNLPNAVTNIGARAFKNLSQLTEFEFPTSLVTIGNEAFSGCSGISELSPPEGIRIIGTSAFRGCSSLATIVLPKGLDSIGDSAFRDCTALTVLLLPNGVRYIGDYAFQDDGLLRRVEIPASVISMGESPFAGCMNVTTVALPGDVKTIASIFPNAYRGITTVMVVRGGLMDDLFKDCSSLTQVEMPSDVTAIGARAFKGCTALAAVGIPARVTSVGAEVFSGCSSLSSVSLPKGLSMLPNGMFTGCSSLLEVIVPENVESVGNAAFSGCTSLRSIKFVGNAPTCSSEAYGNTPSELITYVVNGSRGWDGIVTSKTLPEFWPAGTTHEIYFWEPNRFMVTFDPNDGEAAATNVEQVTGTTYNLPLDAVHLGATFDGWWTMIEGGARVTPVTQVVQTRPHTFYAHWISNKYNVRFDANGGIGDMDVQEFTVATSARLSPCRFYRLEYAFVGWAIEPNGEVVYGDMEEVLNLSYDNNAEVTLFAVWEARPWTLGDYVDATNLIFSNDLAAAWVPDETVFKFGSVSLKSGAVAAATNGGRTSTTISTKVIGEGSGSFWWKVSCEEMDEMYGEWYDYAVFAIDGVEVAKKAGEDGWSLVEYVVSGAGSHTLTWTFTRDDYDEDETVYENAMWLDGVVWTPTLLTVTFDAGGATDGDAPQAITNVAGYELNVPGANTLVKNGYVFAGWTDGERIYLEGEKYVFTADVTLTAVWNLKIWTLGEAVGGDLASSSLLWTTGGDSAWGVDKTTGFADGISVKSGAVTNGQSAWVEVELSGAGTLSFYWNVMGGIYRGNPFAYAKVELDGVEVKQEYNTDGWKEQIIEVVGGGSHKIRWTYLRTSARTAEGDCARLDGVTWTPVGDSTDQTTMTPEPVPYSYFNMNYPALLAEYGGNYEAAANATAANGFNKVWECYVTGISPTNEAAKFSAKIEMKDGAPVVTWKPDLNTNGTVRIYKVYGSETLENGGDWQYPTNSLHKFFKVTVEMP